MFPDLKKLMMVVDYSNRTAAGHRKGANDYVTTSGSMSSTPQRVGHRKNDANDSN